ncbi:MAG: hypothetical protein Fur0018_00670 [Anaerolineales bacterium]
MSVTRVLLVHHNGETRRRLRAAVESLGPDFSVDDVRSGEEALLEFMRQPVDLVVVGLSLLGMSGLELIERVRVRKQDTRVIALSNAQTRDLEKKAQKLGIETIVPSDIESAAFVALIENLLGVEEEILAPPEIPDDSPPVTPEAATPVRQPAIHMDEMTRPSLSMPLTRLRQQIQALSVMLLSDHGRVLAQAGDTPFDSSSALITTLMTAFGAGTKCAQLLGGGDAQNFFVVQGAEHQIYLLSMSNTFALMSLLPGGAVTEIAVMHQEMQTTAGALLALFNNLGVLDENEDAAPVPLPQTGSLDTSLLTDLLPADENLDALFETASTQLNLDQADAFWSELHKEGEGADSVSLNLPDALSYEEALRLGLVPKDEEAS